MQFSRLTKRPTGHGSRQSAYQGTPINTCLPVVGTSSACQWGEGRGTFTNFTRAANGDFVVSNIVKDARTDPFIQTDLSVHHEIAVHEGQRLEFEANVINVFNQRAMQGVSEFAIPTGLISPTRAARFAGDPQVDWGKVMNGYNYVDALNGTGAFNGVQTKLTMASLYGRPNFFQTGRSMRLAVRFVF